MRIIALVVPWLVLVASVAGCGGGEGSSSSSSSSGGGAPGCTADEISLEGGECVTPGVPPELCAKGFEPSRGFSCEPVLPASPCADGEMAVPGEAVCRKVAACPDGDYGDAPDEPATEYVNTTTSCAAQDTDCGSKVKPWPTIQAAVKHAATGAMIAIAAGKYAEDVSVTKNGLRLRGRCPDLTRIVGQDAMLAALTVGPTANGASVTGVSVEGPSVGVWVQRVKDVVLDRIWIHDTEGAALSVGVTTGSATTQLRITGALIERAHGYGLVVVGAQATMEATVVRHTMPFTQSGKYGLGAYVTSSLDSGDPADFALQGSVIEDSYLSGVAAFGAGVTIEGSVVRDTHSDAPSGQLGVGVAISPVVMWKQTGKLTVRSSLLERNHGFGAVSYGGELELEGVVVRATDGQQADGLGGIGIGSGPEKTSGTASPLTVKSCLIEQNRTSGISVYGTQATIDRTRVLDTQPDEHDKSFGFGLTAAALKVAAHVDVTSSLFERSHDAGIVVRDSDVTVTGCVIRDTLTQVSDGRFGDGLSVIASPGAASAHLTSSRIEKSARAGLSSFGGAVELGSTSIVCSAFDIDGETVFGKAPSFQTHDGNHCGCPDAADECHVQSAGLEAPEGIAGP